MSKNARDEFFRSYYKVNKNKIKGRQQAVKKMLEQRRKTMSKGLEAYEIVKEECGFAFGQTANGDRVRENLPIIEKELKALEIIKKMPLSFRIKIIEQANDLDGSVDLLKEVLL